MDKIILRNFKIHKNLELDLSNLTVLAGYNSAGKSSVIQSLILLRQNKLYGNPAEGLDLKGRLCQLGLFKDVLCVQSDTQQMSIRLFDGKAEGFWCYGTDEARGMHKSYVKQLESSARNIEDVNLFGTNFQYISAARWAPRESYPLDSKVVEEERQISKESGQCELTPHFLHHFSKYVVPKQLRLDECTESDLLSQVSAWEGLISKSVNVKPVATGTSYLLNYSYNTSEGESEDFGAVNVGSGLSFVLPVIVALLSTPAGGLILIENPEAHLHPQGQTELAKLISKAAQFGVQVIIETHSDYIINGILMSCQEYERSNKTNGISNDNVSIYQFDKNEGNQLSEIHPIKIGPDGTIMSQPKGFFDQMEKDMNMLLNIEER